MQLVIGRIIRPHGVHGEVVVDVRTDSPAQRFAVGSVLQTEPTATGALTVTQVRPHQGRLLVTFEQVGSRDLAEELRGVLLLVDSASVPAPADPDEFLDHQLIGLRAVTPGGETLGEVVKVDHAPAHDLLVLRLADGRSALVPFVKAIVPVVDLSGGQVVITAPDGLLDL